MHCGNDGAPRELLLNMSDRFNLTPRFEYNYGNSSGMSYYEDQKNNHVLIDVSNNSIFQFDAKTGKELSRFDIPAEGKFKIEKQSDFDGAILHDGAYYYLAHFSNSIFKIDTSSKEITSLLTLDKFKEGILVSSYANPILLKENKIIISLFPDPTAKKQNHGALLVYDIKSGTYSVVCHFPKLYDDNFYGAISYLYWATVKYLPWNNTYVVSFPLDKNLHVYDEDFNFIKAVEMPSSKIKSIPPLTGPVKEGEYPDWQEDNEYYRNMSHYDGLHIDLKNKRILRVARIHGIDENHEHTYSYSLTVAEKDYSILGEWQIPEKYSSFNIFSIPSGVFIFNEAAYTDDRNLSLPFEKIDFIPANAKSGT